MIYADSDDDDARNDSINDATFPAQLRRVGTNFVLCFCWSIWWIVYEKKKVSERSHEPSAPDVDDDDVAA